MDDYVYVVLWLDAGTPNADLYGSRDAVLTNYGQDGAFQNGADETMLDAAESSPGEAVEFGEGMTLRCMRVQP